MANKKNLIIWFVGGSSVGKTTQASNVHTYFKNKCNYGKVEYIKWNKEGKTYGYTFMNPISANLGKFGATACSGTDTLGSKKQIQESLEFALKRRQVVVIEGIMATAQWIDFIRRPDAVVWIILLDCTEKANFRRLQRRRSLKLQVPIDTIEITQKTKDNLAGKLRGFRSLFLKVKDRCDYATYLDTSKSTAKEICALIEEGLSDIILSEF